MMEGSHEDEPEGMMPLPESGEPWDATPINRVEEADIIPDAGYIDSRPAAGNEAEVSPETVLFLRAFEAATLHPRTMADIAGLTDDQSMQTLYYLAHSWPEDDSHSRFRVFAERSLRPDGEEAWSQALAYAEQYSPPGERPLLEELATSQSDPARLAAITAAAERQVSDVIQAHTLRAVATRLADTDDIAHALTTIVRMSRRGAMPDQIDEARLAVVSYWARRGGEIPHYTGGYSAADNLNGLSQQMQPWGLIKIGTALRLPEGDPLWSRAHAAVQACWGDYTERQQLAIVDDLRRGGQFGLALWYGGHLLASVSNEAIHEETYRTMVKVAHDRGKKMGLPDGLETLDLLQRYNEAQLRSLESNRLKGDVPPTVISRAINAQHAMLGRLSGERAALMAAIDPTSALAILQQGDYRGPQQREHRNAAYAITAAALARHGEIEEAIGIADRIEGEPFNNPSAARAYAAIGNALLAQRGNTA